MEFFDACARQAAAYPRWLVITSLVLTTFAVWWLVVKVLKWAFLLLLACVAVAAVGLIFILFMG